MTTHSLLYVLAGALVGTFVGLTGVGGGSLMTPILVLAFGQSPTFAVGTDLLFASITKLAATATYTQSRRVDWPIVGLLARGSLPGVALVLLVLWLDRAHTPTPDQWVLKALGLMLVLTAAALVAQAEMRRRGVQLTVAFMSGDERQQRRLTILTGLLLGVAVTLTSIGAGALGVVALVLLYPLRLTPDRLVATDIAHALPLTLFAGLGHLALGHVSLETLALLLCGSVPAVVLAARTTLRLPPFVTRVLIAVMLAVVGLRILLA